VDTKELAITRAQASRAAIERLYVEMRHLFNRGTYRRLGDMGEVLTEALLTLRPEIYGSMGDQEKVELDGLVYVVDRLPRGIEECRFVKLISEEGYRDAGFETIVPAKRRRNCYRIDKDHMYIEVTRGRSEIYDILTHLTFMYIEAEKIRLHALDEEGKPVEKDSMGYLRTQMVADDTLGFRENYRKGDVRDYVDGDNQEFVNYGYGEWTLIADSSRVYKGGSWADRLYWLSPGTRRYKEQNKSSSKIGFRCAMIRVGGETGNEDMGGLQFQEKGRNIKRRYK